MRVKSPRLFDSKSSPDLAARRAEDLHNAIKLLHPNDLIEILWIDACIARDRKVAILKNYDFATYKRSVGYYVGVLLDHRYKQEYLIISPEMTDEGEAHEARDIESIPLAIVMKVRRVGEKVTLRSAKGKYHVKAPIKLTKLKWAEFVTPLEGEGEKIVLAKEVKV